MTVIGGIITQLCIPVVYQWLYQWCTSQWYTPKYDGDWRDYNTGNAPEWHLPCAAPLFFHLPNSTPIDQSDCSVYTTRITIPYGLALPLLAVVAYAGDTGPPASRSQLLALMVLAVPSIPRPAELLSRHLTGAGPTASSRATEIVALGFVLAPVSLPSYP
jgi:hypothetical protein